MNLEEAFKGRLDCALGTMLKSHKIAKSLFVAKSLGAKTRGFWIARALKGLAM